MPQDTLIRRKQAAIATLALAAIGVHLVLRFGTNVSEPVRNAPLWVALALGGVPLVWELLVKLTRREFGSDLLAGISIVTSVILDEYLAGTLVVLMLSGGDAANTQMIVHDYGDRALVFEVRGLPTKPYKDANVGVIFEGSEGYVVMPSYSSGAAFDLAGNKVHEFNGGGDHYGNFIEAVRSRDAKSLNAEILEGHLSSALCHLGNISYRLGTPLSVAEVKERLRQ